MITTLWTIGLILFFLSLACSMYSDSPSAFRTYHAWEARALWCMILAVVCFGFAMYLTSQEEKTVGQVSDQQTLDKWQNLAGKELLIRVGQVPVEGQPDELGKGMHYCVIGVDKTDGKCYVLHTGIEEYK